MTRGILGGLKAPWRRPVGALLAVTIAGMALLGAPSIAVADGTTATPQVVIQETQDGQPVYDPTPGPGNDTGGNNGIVRTNDLVNYSVTMSINDPTAPTQTTFQHAKATFAPLPLGFVWNALPLDCLSPGSSLTGDGVATPSVLVCDFGAKTTGTTWNFKPAIKVLWTASTAVPLAPSATLSATGMVKTAVAPAPNVTVSVSSAPKAGVTIVGPISRGGAVLNGGAASRLGYPVGIHMDSGSDVINGNSFSFTADLSGLPAGAVFESCGSYNDPLSPMPNSSNTVVNGVQRGVATGSGTWTCTPDASNPQLIHITVKGVNTDPTTCPTQGSDGSTLVSGMCYVGTQYINVLVPNSGLTVGGSQNTMWVSNLTAADTLGNPNYGGANDPGTGKTNNDVASSPFLAGKQHGWTSRFPGPPQLAGAIGTSKSDYKYFDPTNGQPARFTAGGVSNYTPMTNNIAVGSSIGSGDGYISQTGRYSAAVFSGMPGVVDVPAGFTQCMTIDNKNATIAPLNSGMPTRGASLNTGFPSAGWVVQYGTGGSGGVNSGDGTGWASTAAQQAGSCNTADSPVWYSDLSQVPGGAGAVTKVRAFTANPITVADQLGQSCSPNCGNALWVTLQVRATTPAATIVPNYAWYTNDPAAVTASNPSGTVVSSYNVANATGLLGDRITVTGVRAMISKSASVQQTLAGSTVGFTLKPATDALGNSTPFQALNLTVTDTLPKGETYVPGSSACATTPCEPSVTANADGTTTLVWSLGSPVAGTPITPITYKATIGALVSDGTSLVNTAVISASNDGSPASPYRTATATVSVVNSASFAVQKSLVNPLTEPGAQKIFNLQFTNLSNNIYAGTDFIDWLPFNGDGRTPASNFHGTLTLAGPAVDVAGAQTVTFRYTSFPTAQLNMATDSDPATANPAIVWCTPAQFGTPGCPANYAAATGIRIDGGQILAQQSDTVQITTNATGDVNGDVFSNQSTGEISGLGLPISSNTATGRTVLGSIAGTVWDDTAPGATAPDGIIGSGEPDLANVTVQLRDSTGAVIATTTTDAAGHYVFPDLLHGSYSVHVVAPARYYTTVPLAGSDPTVNSKIAYGTNTTGTITLTVGQNNLIQNAGFFKIAPAITIEKDLNGTHAPDPAHPVLVATGSTMNVTFKVTNTGNTTLSPVKVTDDVIPANAISCPATSLAAGATMTCTATTPAPATPGGTHVDHATATGSPAGLDGTPLVDANGTKAADVTATDEAHAFTPDPHLALVKTATPTRVTKAGDTVVYSFLVTNTGNVTVTNVGVTETAFTGTGTAPATTCPAAAASVAPGASVTCTATYAVTQADVDAGTVTNTAVAQGTPPLSLPPVLSNPSSAIVTAQPGPAITLVKSATPAQVSKAGDTVGYSFLVTNTGNVTLANAGVTETAFSGTGTTPAITCPAAAASVAPGASVTCTATYAVTQADVDAGKITNTATAQGTPPGTTAPVVSAPSSAVVTVPPAPALALVKSATPTTVTKAGDTVTYSFLVTNTGNVTLTKLGITETAFSGTGTAPAAACPPGPLAPGTSLTCTATYAVTQADVDAGTVTNTATAQGTPPGSATPVVSNPSSAVVTAQQSGAITLVKSATPAQVSKAGDSVTYSFLVTNTGNVTLANVGITETAFSGTGTAPVVACPAAAASLAPGASVTCTATYAVTQADVDAGKITNTATAQGTPPGTTTPVVSAPSSALVTVPPAPVLALVKTATPSRVTKAGDTVSYSFLVTNTGNVTLANISVAETAFSGTGTPPVITCPPAAASLAPGASVTCTATYAVTQADVDAGTVTNTATAQGTPPGSSTPVVSNPSSAVVTAQPGPALTLVKSATPSDAAHFTVGQQITYSFVVTNTGNVTLTGVNVTETAFTGTGTLSPVACPGDTGAGITLAPGAQITCTATYQVTQADVDAGSVTNTAVAHGTPPGTPTPVDSNPSTVKIPGAQNPTLALVKSATPTTVSKAGDSVAYSFLVTNTGNVTLANVGVTETAFSGTGTTPAASCPPGTLAPGASVTCTATYTVTQADVDAGTVTNTATAQGTPPNTTTPVVSNPSSAVVTAQQSGAITLVKSAIPTTVSKAGDSVSYTFLVTNTGNVTLANVGVTETAFSGTGSVPVVACPAGAASLAPGASVTCTASYAVTQADVDAGKVTNTATAQGTPPGANTPLVSNPSSAVVTVPPAPGIALVKTATPSQVSKAGDTVSYSLLVSNPGNTTLANVGVTETAFSGTGTAPAITCPAGAASLAPGASATCTASYAVTQADVDTGKITNTATAQGTPPGSPTQVVSTPSSAVVTAQPAPALALAKTADTPKVTQAGQSITYSFKVTNTGNTTVTGIGIREDTFNGTGSLSPATCPAGAAALAPGATVTCTATYKVTQADLDSGVPLVNTATATGKSPAGKDVVSNQSTATVTTPGAPVANPPGARVETGGYTLTGPGTPAGPQPWAWAFATGVVTAAGALLLIRRRSRR